MQKGREMGGVSPLRNENFPETWTLTRDGSVLSCDFWAKKHTWLNISHSRLCPRGFKLSKVEPFYSDRVYHLQPSNGLCLLRRSTGSAHRHPIRFHHTCLTGEEIERDLLLLASTQDKNNNRHIRRTRYTVGPLRFKALDQ